MKQKDIGRQAARQDRMIRERQHDTYKLRQKMTDPTVCPQCGAVYRKGGWHWSDRPSGAQEALCQACQRIKDDYPAGYVTLKGAFLKQREAEIVALARHQEKAESQNRPLHRIMAVRSDSEGVEIQTTDIHLPRRIGEAVLRAYKGELNYRYEDETYRIRVSWRRDT